MPMQRPLHTLIALILVAAACSERQSDMVTLLSQPVTLGPEPLKITPPTPVRASGSVLRVGVHFPQGTSCTEALGFNEVDQLRLDVSAVTSNGRYELKPVTCGRGNELFFEIEVRSSHHRELHQLEVSSSGSVEIGAVTWWKEFELGNL